MRILLIDREEYHAPFTAACAEVTGIFTATPHFESSKAIARADAVIANIKGESESWPIQVATDAMANNRPLVFVTHGELGREITRDARWAERRGMAVFSVLTTDPADWVPVLLGLRFKWGLMPQIQYGPRGEYQHPDYPDLAKFVVGVGRAASSAGIYMGL